MFRNRSQAGRLLGEKILEDIKKLGIETVMEGKQELRENFVILGIPRGGVVVAKEIAKILDCSLDIIVTRKIGAPGNEELAIGAVGETEGSKYIDQRLAADVGADEEYLKSKIKEQKEEIKRREGLYRKGKEPLALENKIVILVDDGVATGATMIAAAREVWNHSPKRVIIALPVCPKDTLAKLEKEADQVIVLKTPWPFFAVGQFYKEFGQVSDEEVVKLLQDGKLRSTI